MKRPLYWGPIWGFIGLDILTYLIVYLLVLPPLEPVTKAVDPILIEATGYLLTGLRLGFIGAITARWIKNRYGLQERRDAIPTLVLAAGLGWLIHVALNFFSSLAFAGIAWDWAYLLAFVQWLGFALIGALFIAPGSAAERGRVAFRFADDPQRGAASLFLIPTVALLVFASLAAIVILGSTTNSRRTADTGADAAALAAGEVWEETLHGKFSAALSASESAVFWELVGVPLSYGLPYEAMYAAAADYAYRNDGELVSFNVDSQRAAVQVKVRHETTATGESRKTHSMAESSLRFNSGLCHSGGVLGYLISGQCVTTPPVEDPPSDDGQTDPDDGEEPEDGSEEEEEEFEPPQGLSSWNVSVVLTDAG